MWKVQNSKGRPVCNSCFSYDKFIPIAITNADRIRSMSDEELADFIRELNEECIDCKDIVLEWLQSEAAE